MGGSWSEERFAAYKLELKLRRNPEVTRRREAYNRSVKAAREEAERLGKKEVIDRLCESNPSYIRSLLESEDVRFGVGALNERFARTFWTEFREADQ